MMSSVMTVTELDKLDLLFRKSINAVIRRRLLSKDMFYSGWQYGGIGNKKMRERYSICKMNNVAHFSLLDDDTRRFIN
jgi:hypothetical protein